MSSSGRLISERRATTINHVAIVAIKPKPVSTAIPFPLLDFVLVTVAVIAERTIIASRPSLKTSMPQLIIADALLKSLLA